MKLLYVAGVFGVLMATVAVAQTPSAPTPSVNVPGYTCTTQGNMSRFTATCTRNIVQRAVPGIPGPYSAPINTPYARMMTQMFRFPMYGGPENSESNQRMICNGDIYTNLTRQCGPAANDGILQMRDICVRERHAGSCGLTDITDCCNPVPERSS